MIAGTANAAAALLRWYAESGVDEAVGTAPHDFFMVAHGQAAVRRPAPRAVPAPIAPAPQVSADEAVAAARALAGACARVEDLAAAVAAFDGCPLKAGARTTVFADGVFGASLLVIGEAPGKDEDQAGKPFVGRAGQLLDRMLAAIGRSRRENTLISNVIFWRPPGNRTPAQAEIEVCKPFVERLIELTAPKAVMLAGGVPTQALLGLGGIMRARGAWREIELASGARVPALPVFHPAFLLRQPAHKRLAWRDLQSLAARLTTD
ncbi:MAG TPA: uracil-DNA glycosylase [Parvularcula sp.]|nr:uracil-DNA glycosylase [Parvularcula sp.]HBS30670.1 uracil-DNA glycosylase [Parvularcula sp.]HBS34428.1 uracil-DNA glycosylase [Parvularcula sp.]